MEKRKTSRPGRQEGTGPPDDSHAILAVLDYPVGNAHLSWTYVRSLKKMILRIS
jgi:hypothetical protein